MTSVAALADHGEQLRFAGKLREAETELTHAVTEARRVFAADDPNLPRTISSLATLYFDLGDYSRAKPLFLEAIDLYRAQSPRSFDLVYMLNSVGLIDLRAGDLKTAASLFFLAIEVYRALDHRETESLGFTPDRSRWNIERRALHNMAVRFGEARNFEEAGLLFHNALEKRRALFGESHPETIESVTSFGTFWLVQGNFANAEPLFRRALDLTRQTLGDNHLTTAERLLDLALCIKQKRTFGAAQEAEPLLRQAYAIRRARLGDDHSSTQFVARELLEAP